jgi:Fur family ferric uptake transcriptional regulator
MTKQRRVILEELGAFESHPTADEIYERVRTRLPRVSLGTVYRNLELLSRCGIIRKLEIGGQQMRFDRDLHQHQHIRCLRCGRVDDVPGDPEPTECDRDMLDSTGYELVERRVEFLGFCPKCRDSGKKGIDG